jgi:ABC-type methionine transport system permease subunit
MRGLESVGIGLALLLVPLAAWIVGREAGRRDASVVAVILAAVLAALAAQAIAGVGSAALEAALLPASGGLAASLSRRAAYWAAAPEFAGFLVIFGVFVGMVGWSSVPASKSTSS